MRALAKDRKADPRFAIPADFDSPIFQLLDGSRFEPPKA